MQVGLSPIQLDKMTEISSVNILCIQNNIGDMLRFIMCEQTFNESNL